MKNIKFFGMLIKNPALLAYAKKAVFSAINKKK